MFNIINGQCWFLKPPTILVCDIYFPNYFLRVNSPQFTEMFVTNIVSGTDMFITGHNII